MVPTEAVGSILPGGWEGKMEILVKAPFSPKSFTVLCKFCLLRLLG